MARRFARENFLFPRDLRGASFQVAARPVDAFERASQGTVEQAPTRPYEVSRPDTTNNLVELGQSLGIATEVFGKIGASQYEDYTQRAEAAGAALAAEDELRGNKQSWRQLVSRTRVNAGDEQARQLQGMNPHLKRGFDQTRARSSALNYNAELQSAYALNPALTEDDNGPRLHDVDTSDPMYQQWLSNFKTEFEANNGIQTLDPAIRSTIIPAQQDADNRVTMAHSELRSARKLQEFEDSTAQFIDTVVYDLNGNSAWLAGQDNQALSLAANYISQQLDEANALGYGGDDLKALYAMTVEMVISAAVTTGNPALLETLQFVEVGPPDNRTLLTQTSEGAKYRNAIKQAQTSIVDREFQLTQRDRQTRDQEKEDSLNEVIENIAITAGLYESLGRTPEARQTLDAVIDQGRVQAAQYGFTAEFNSVITRITQDAVDNQGVNIIDYQSMAALEDRIINGQVGGNIARRQLRDLFYSGALGNNQQASENFLRLSSKIEASNDQALNMFGGQVDRAAAEFAQVVQQRSGYTEDERGRLTSFKNILNGADFSDEQIAIVTQMSQAEMTEYLTDRAEKVARGEAIPFSAEVVRVLNMVVNEGIDPLNPPPPVDPGEALRQEIEFKNALYSGFREFRQREGRDMTPQEMGEFVRGRQEAALTGQLSNLPSSNPLSTRRYDASPLTYSEEAVYDSFFEGLADEGSDPRSTLIFDEGQLLKAIDYFIETKTWHPEILSLADSHRMNPMELFQTQANLSSIDIHPDILIDLGVPTSPTATDSLPGMSVYSRNTDVSSSYVDGEYTIFRGYFIDDYSSNGTYMPGSYDFTLIQNDSDQVNVPAPFDGIVTEVWTEAESGGYGNGITIKDRETGVQMFLAHAEAVYLKVGDTFVKGQAIMKQGTTGSSSAEHIHAEILDDNGVRIADRSFTRPIIERWLEDIQRGEFLPSNNRRQPSAANFSTPRNPELGSLIVESAQRLGVTPTEWASLLALESSLDVNAVGTDRATGKTYEGLAQFGPAERAQYGMYAGMPAAEQFPIIERFLNDRGYRPGMGIEGLYATILGGNPTVRNVADSNSTTASGAAREFQPGGRYYQTAQTILGF